ncbi:hypothetical protein I6A84_13565 [Frankia sp. CNm7]|uniref:Uncharacterized protein n=1 Tax=Frankia nepalensis TaxID=1836974 RepID=A0A937R9C6_9ACTN|nr:DUF6204 family protein [Frankia nepalensis]MBL7496945.1 hypothetical protein [Frankia nepalensis]MBL7513435.1 hypothetical protein [Frankia nepalensis]MBL7519106.1 hypothetical protein [Frankia nepalensis]MBL7626122.1 hypothetical protein [Frankia nepalensis]
MSGRTYRVTVRGMFDGLSDAQRAELLGKASEHDVLHAAFTSEGHLSYDLAARPFFTFRFLDVRPDEDDRDPVAELDAAAARAERAARAWLDERGYGYRDLRASAEDLAEMALGSRGRREARRTG